MKAFDFEKARQGKPVCTRGGKEVRILCFERVCNNGSPIVALVKNEDGIENVCTYPKTGKFMCDDKDHENDLVMAPVKKKVWINFYKTAACNIISDQLTWDSKDDAVKNSMEHTGWLGAYEVEVEI